MTAALRCAAQPTAAQPVRAGGRQSNSRKGFGKLEAADRQVHELARTPRQPSPTALCPSLPDRHAPSAHADRGGWQPRTHPHSHRNGHPRRAALRSSSSCTVAPAGRRVEHMTHELLLPSADPCALVLLCHAQRWGTGMRRMHTHTSSPFRPLRRRSGLALQVEPLHQAKTEVHPLAVLVGLHGGASACTYATSIWAKYSSRACMHWPLSAQIWLEPICRHGRSIVQGIKLRGFGGDHPRCMSRVACLHVAWRYLACDQVAPRAVVAAEKALLADVAAKNLDASYIELLRLFKARCRMGTRSARCFWCM